MALPLVSSSPTLAQPPSDSTFIAPWDTVRGTSPRSALDSLLEAQPFSLTPASDSLIADSARLPAQQPVPAPATMAPIGMPNALQARWEIARVEVGGIHDPRLRRRAENRLRQAVDSVSMLGRDSANVAALRMSGYPEAQPDSVIRSGRRLTAAYKTGPLYVYDSLWLEGANPQALAPLNMERMARRHLPFSWLDLDTRLKLALRYYENIGYPFARFRQLGLGYRRLGPDTVGVLPHYALDLGPLVTLDSLQVEGNIRERAKFVARMARIRPGTPFSQAEIDNLPRLLNNTLYYQNVRPARVVFQGNSAVAIVPLERRRANRFDALLGLLPPRDQTQALQFTGLVDLQLVSAFRAGEIIQLRYERLLGQSQIMNLGYQQPFLFGTPFKVAAKFNLFRQDTLFITTTFEPSVGYALSRTFLVRAYYRAERSSLLSAAPYRTLKWPPPPVMNTRNQMYGVGLTLNSLDNLYNPGRGFVLETDVAFGTKRVLGTVGLDSLEFERLALSQPRTEASLLLQWFVPTLKRQVLLLANRTFWLGLQEYYENDHRFVGGARSLRGFNENEFPTSLSSIATLEYRLRLTADSYIGAFTDVAYLQRTVFQTTESFLATGVGFTLSTRTPAGLVAVSYAVGRSPSLPFQPSRGRIHLGLVNTF